MLLKEIKRLGGKLLREVVIFDKYECDKIALDKKSLAFKLTFNDLNRTLTDEEVMEIFEKIIAGVTKKFNCLVRDK